MLSIATFGQWTVENVYSVSSTNLNKYFGVSICGVRVESVLLEDGLGCLAVGGQSVVGPRLGADDLVPLDKQPLKKIDLICRGTMM
jgi:hypothetical protein